MKADADGIAAPAVVMTTDVLVVAPHDAVKPETLLRIKDRKGVADPETAERVELGSSLEGHVRIYDVSHSIKF